MEAHGSFAAAHCISCKAEEDVEAIKSMKHTQRFPKYFKREKHSFSLLKYLGNLVCGILYFNFL